MGRRKQKTNSDGAVAAEIRRRIAEGEWKPGLRLPTWRDLQREFGFSQLPIELAMRSLLAEGFIRADGRVGTYVADAPPCFSKFGLVFPWRETPANPWPKFWHAMQWVAEHWTAEGPEQWVMYYDDLERAAGGGAGNEDYQRLLADTLERRVAGLVFATRPWPLGHTPVLQQRIVPMSTISGEPGLPGVGLICLDMDAWLERALDRLKERHCQRIAFLGPATIPDRFAHLAAIAAARGVKVEPFAIQTAAVLDPIGIQRAAHLLGMLGPGLRPDGLIITDDNLIAGAAAGLAAAGLAVPRDIEVVAHWNFPLVPPENVPFQWLGFDAEEVLRACHKNLRHTPSRRGNNSAPKIPPRFLGELVRD